MHAQSWDALVDSYFDEAVFPFGPSNAVQSGFHAYDAQLEDFSQASIQKEIAAAHRFQERFTAFPVSQLSTEQRADRDMVLSNIQSNLTGDRSDSDVGEGSGPVCVDREWRGLSPL